MTDFAVKMAITASTSNAIDSAIDHRAIKLPMT